MAHGRRKTRRRCGPADGTTLEAPTRRTALIIGARSTNAAAMTAVLVVQLLRVQGHGSPVQVGLLLALGAVPGVALMSVAGRLADRNPGPRFYALWIVLQTLLTALLATKESFAVVVILFVLLESLSAMLGPLWIVAVSCSVREADLAGVLARYHAALTLAPIAGSAGAGVLYGFLGSRRSLLVVAVVLGLTLVATLAMKTVVADNPGSDGNVGRPDGGLAILSRAPILFRVLLVLLPVSFLLQCLTPLEVFLARQEMGIGPAAFGGVEALFGVGAVVGASSSRWFATDEARARGVMVALAAVGAMLLAHGTTTVLAIYLLTGVVIGGTASLSNALMGALLVTQTESLSRGRAAAALNGLSQAVALLALSIGGLLGAAVGIRESFALSGALSLSVGVVGWAVARRHRPGQLSQAARSSRR